ncbi:hypothetical protein [Nonomuraea sp. NPDC049309]|uniref:hypothetical protein n=1 Tax=Nonomuraea sp. NPDC049309 TaxID=3364350 RepID=UPI0037191B43
MAISGGYRLQSGGISVDDSVVSVVTSAPNNANNGWEVLVFNNSNFSATFVPYVICANQS